MKYHNDTMQYNTSKHNMTPTLSSQLSHLTHIFRHISVQAEPDHEHNTALDTNEINFVKKALQLNCNSKLNEIELKIYIEVEGALLSLFVAVSLRSRLYPIVSNSRFSHDN
eukprot:c2338_g1_i1.p1 GENE.c2338_g1_i1~~c2338_g1_i1.p1  ORF type:complete len:118 (+),score=7.65 c2338_g1_i1:22-354(+)